jgi:hypothetical protein
MPPYSNNNSEWTSSNSSTTSSSRVTNNQQPKSALHLSSSVNNNQQPNDLLELAAQELETMKQPKNQQSHYYVSKIPTDEHSFPPACLRLMSSLPGNLTCIDCHSRTDISWASVSFGCLMCLQCSGKHRSLGVQTSFVKSVSMDGWKVHEVLSMLEGGNEQLDQFFERHEMGKKSSGTTTAATPTSPTASGTLLDRYKTKAASFYRQHLINHAKKLGEGGIYKGREASRSKQQQQQQQKSSPSSSSRKHQRNNQQRQHSKSKLLSTVTESSTSTAESETTTSSNHNLDRSEVDAPSLPPLLSPSQQQPLKRHRSKGSGSDVSSEMNDLDLDRMEY